MSRTPERNSERVQHVQENGGMFASSGVERKPAVVPKYRGQKEELREPLIRGGD